MKLAHELGHCCTGSFYNQWATADCRRRHENVADKWAIQVHNEERPNDPNIGRDGRDEMLPVAVEVVLETGQA